MFPTSDQQADFSVFVQSSCLNGQFKILCLVVAWNFTIPLLLVRPKCPHLCLEACLVGSASTSHRAGDYPC